MSEGISLNLPDAYGYYPLHHAVLSGDLSTVLMCLPRSSPIGEMTEVTVPAQDSLTALHIAAKDRNPQIAHAIVSYAKWMVRTALVQCNCNAELATNACTHCDTNSVRLCHYEHVRQ